MIIGSKFNEFVSAAIAIMLIPGPSVMFTIARAIAWGRFTAFLTVVGNAFGMLVLAQVIALGLGPILQTSEILLTLVQLFGGLYLIYLGFEAIKTRKIISQNLSEVNEIKPNNFLVLRQGFVVGISNPKALVFFSAIFPQFVDPQAGSITIQMVWFGVTFALLAIFFDGLWAFFVGGSRDWFANSKNRLVTMRTIGGFVMIALGSWIVLPLAISYLI